MGCASESLVRFTEQHSIEFHTRSLTCIYDLEFIHADIDARLNTVDVLRPLVSSTSVTASSTTTRYTIFKFIRSLNNFSIFPFDFEILLANHVL